MVVAWLVGGLIGLALGLVVGVAISTVLVRNRERRKRLATIATPPIGGTPVGTAPGGPGQSFRSGSPSSAAAIKVVLDNEAGRQMGIALAGKSPTPQPLLELARSARREGVGAALQADMRLPSFGWRSQPLEVRVRAVGLEDGLVALLVEDVTESRRVEAVRRDFVANVGHEIKTPVGALALLAEAAVETAEDDREQMLRFLARIRREAARLSKLVTELIDLSRVQGAEARPDPAPVDLDAVLAEAIDRISYCRGVQGHLGRGRRRLRRERFWAANRSW